MEAITLIILLLVGGFVVGLVIGRWWALVLALLVPLAFVPLGDDSDGDPAWMWGLVLYAPPAFVGLVLGVGARQAMSRRAGPGGSRTRA